MKIVRIYLDGITVKEETIMVGINEVECLEICNKLNNAGLNEKCYYQAMPEDN